MSFQELKLTKDNAIAFEDFVKNPIACENLFVITHLGQLKQMESLIRQKNIENNLLVVLYTIKNLEVPSSVGNQASDELFSKVVFLEIPFGANKISYNNTRNISKIYIKLFDVLKPNYIYLNSFEGHYAILHHIAKSKLPNIDFFLIEEGTATYKFNLENDDSLSIDYALLKNRFMNTIGKTQIFKKVLRFKKDSKELVLKTKKFTHDLWLSEPVQAKLIKIFGNDLQKSSLAYIDSFKKIYASHPELLIDHFYGDMEYFSGFDDFNQEELDLAESIVKKYNIKKSDVLFLSQRYPIDSELYTYIIFDLLNRMIDPNSQIYVKLHPKESEDVLAKFKENQLKYPNRIIIIDEPKFLVEPLIKVSEIKLLVGLTSSSLIYAPDISESTMSVSIAGRLIEELERFDGNEQAIALIKEHLDIIHLFDKVSIL